MRPEAQFAIHPCARFSADPKLLHDQAIKRVLKYFKVTSNNGIIMNPDPENGVECYVDTNFVGGRNQ